MDSLLSIGRAIRHFDNAEKKYQLDLLLMCFVEISILNILLEKF